MSYVAAILEPPTIASIMNIFQQISMTIIKKSFHLSVWTIEQFHDIALYEQKGRKLQELPDGTLGKEIGKCLERNGLRLVPQLRKS